MEYQNGQLLLGPSPAGDHGPNPEQISRPEITVPLEPAMSEKNLYQRTEGRASVSLFERIRSELARAIRSAAVAKGQVLIEGRIAELFGTSRAPVRKALQLLTVEGLAHRFQGRGYIAGSSPQVAPVRRQLDIDIGGEDGADRSRTRQRDDVVLENVLQHAAIAIAFGGHRHVNRVALVLRAR